MPISDAEFRSLYDTHIRLVRRALRRLGVREADLMDQTQKVFLVVHRKLPDFEGRSELSTWLLGICRRIAIAYRRSAAIRHEIATDPLNLEAVSEQRGAATGEMDTARQVALERILSKLSEPQRVVFTLVEVDGLCGYEVAAHLHISLGTVRSRLRCARQLLRREVHRLALTSAFQKTRQRALRRPLSGARAIESDP